MKIHASMKQRPVLAAHNEVIEGMQMDANAIATQPSHARPLNQQGLKTLLALDAAFLLMLSLLILSAFSFKEANAFKEAMLTLLPCIVLCPNGCSLPFASKCAPRLGVVATAISAVMTTFSVRSIHSLY